jgi:hypothetical protein
VALNAPLSGIGFSKILDCATSKGIDKTDIEFLSYEYWSSLYDKHINSIGALFDYRVFVTELEVIELMRKGRYFDRYL